MSTSQKPLGGGVVESPPSRPARGRPSARGTTRDELIRYGMEVLTEKGFSSTGIDEVLKAVGVPKGSFYHYFASKDDFGRAVIDAFAAYFADKLDRTFGDATRPPLDRLRAFIDEVRRGMRKHGYRRGCLVGNLGQECACLNDMFRIQINKVFADWQTRLAACLEEARLNGDIDADADPKQLAAYFWIGWEGAVMRAKLERSAKPLDLFAQMYLAQLESRPAATGRARRQ